MATIAEFSIGADGFPLGSIFENHPGVTVDLEQVIPTTITIIPYFWIMGVADEEEQTIEAEFAACDVVHDVKLVDKVAGRYLMRVQWETEYDGVLQAIAETDVVLISGVGTAEEWVF